MSSYRPESMGDGTSFGAPPAGAKIEFVSGADQSCIRTAWAGTGPTVVLAHGYLLDLAAYNLVFEALVALGYRVIVFDQRGHGGSTPGRDGMDVMALARDYQAVFEHYGVQDGCLVGHSMGAFLSVLFCLEHRAAARRHLSRMVLLGGTAGNVAKGSLPNKLQLPLLKSGIMPPLWRLRGIGNLIVSQVFGRDADARFVDETRRTLQRQNVQRTLPIVEAMIQSNYYPRLHEIDLPTQVVCGTMDRTCPSWHSERLGREMANARNTWLPNIGHMLVYEAPGAIVDAVRGPHLDRW